MNAAFEDAAMGWEIFKDHRGRLSLVELNEALVARGFRPVAPRTFDHYRKLRRLGYQNYLSINRLDLRHASSSVFDLADRSRYSGWSVEAPASLFVPFESEVERLPGQVTRVSEGFADFLTPISASATRVARARRYKRGVLLFERVGVERAVEVLEWSETDGFVHLVLSFRSLLETDLLFPDRIAPKSVQRLRVPLGPDASLYSVMTVFRRSFDLYESMRGFADAYSAAAYAERPLLVSPRVRRLRVENPFELDIVGSPVIWPLLLIVIRIVVPVVTRAVRDFQEMSHAAAAEARERDRHPLELKAMELENLRAQVQITQLIQELDPSLRRMFELVERRDDGVAQDLPSDRLEALKNQSVEAAAEIAAQSSGEVELGEPSDKRTGH